jgi:hypothetical protein
MLEFSAQDYVEISHQLGMVRASLNQKQASLDDLGKSLEKLSEDINRLGLFVTREALGVFVLELVKANPKNFRIVGKEGNYAVKGSNALDADRMSYHLECIYSTLRAELSSMAFRAIPAEKSPYCRPKWLFESPIYKNFPTGWKEFQSAGRCYAFGENTACAFHLNRALEWGLKSLAVELGKPFDKNSWDAHLKDIDRELVSRYKAAGARSPAEEFYSQAAAQFGNMKVAWRNPTMHIEAQYDDKEGAYLLATVEEFMNHLAKKGLAEPK